MARSFVTYLHVSYGAEVMCENCKINNSLKTSNILKIFETFLGLPFDYKPILFEDDWGKNFKVAIRPVRGARN